MNHLAQLRRDEEKRKFCELNGIKLLEIFPEDNVDDDFLISLGVSKN